jgi:hypothetical protein
MNLKDFTTKSVKEYLHTIVFVDDKIYGSGPGQPTDAVPLLPELPELKSPFVGSRSPEPPAAVPDERPAYHPRQLLESFAREGMVCALYEPRPGFETDEESELFKLCARADVIILDWDLYDLDGDNLLPLIRRLVSESVRSVPHHVRLCAIYTTKPNLLSVASAIDGHLRAAALKVAAEAPSTLIAGATRIVVLGKPGVVGRTPESKALEVNEEDLAGRIIDEFSRMHTGILPSFALHGLASIRRNSKRILDKFHADIDGAFLLHRAALIASDGEAAFEQLPDLLAEEALAVMIDEHVPANISKELAEEEARALPLGGLDWPRLDGKAREQNQELARLYLTSGATVFLDALSATQKKQLKKQLENGEHFKQFHDAMGCANTGAAQRMAALFNLRTRYVENNPPDLGFGVVVRRTVQVGAAETLEYSICLMPLCDAVRLPLGKRSKFPFWSLVRGRGDGRGIVVEAEEGQYEDLFTGGKPRDRLWLGSFEPDASGTVTSQREGSKFWFSGETVRLQWVAQLKPSHAQRVAHDIGQSFSRVGVVEAEWLRLMAGG